MKRYKIRKRALREKDFIDAKKLLEMGISPSNVARSLERSVNTITQIRKVNSFLEYKNLIREIRNKYPINGKLPEPKKENNLSEEFQKKQQEKELKMTAIWQFIKEHSEEKLKNDKSILAVLKEINYQLARLANAWENK